MASSPFAGAGGSPCMEAPGTPVVSGPSQASAPTLFSQGGSFLQAGASPFAAAAAAASVAAHQVEAALNNIKAQVVLQKDKLGALEVEAKVLRDAAQVAAASEGTDVETTEQEAFVKETEVDTERIVLEGLGKQQSVLEQESFQKAPAQEKGRPGPF